MDIWALVQNRVAETLPGHTPERVRLLARHAAASIRAPEWVIPPPPEAFGTLLGAPLFHAVRSEGGWLLFTPSDAFYSACVRETLRTLPRPATDLGSYPLNRMLALSRQGGTGCPSNADIRRALWLLLGAAYGRTSANEAARAFLRMLYALPARDRMQLRRSLGETADACARLTARALQTEF